MPRVDVDLPGSPYSIHIGKGVRRQAGPLLRDLGASGAVALVTHSELPPLHAAGVVSSLEDAGFQVEHAFVPQGEASKSLEALASLYHRFAQMRLDRRSTVVALGGGVIGDLAGFAAATYLRGIGLVQVPTTLLAQVDASVGGKTAIDLPAGKNLVGAFYQPRLVVADVETLSTLTPAELRSGLAEVVKYGVIADAALFDYLEREAGRILAGDPDALERIVVRSCEIKADVVRQDPTEQGLRAILNYGHTLGHALEAVLGYGVIPHGEAVAMGMSAAAKLAVRLGLFDPAAAARQDQLLHRFGLPVWGGVRTTDPMPHTQHLTPDTLLDAMMLDKKTIAGRLRFVLPRALGAVEVQEVPTADVEAVLCSETAHAS
jgi:3-dehydroquinate synthase